MHEFAAELLGKTVRWTWGSKQEQAFEKARNALQRDSLLIHFDPAKPLLLACDASPYGLGAVLYHIVSEGVERPVAYVLRTLTAAEKKYSQLEKEGLAIVFGVKKFHNYIYGWSFVSAIGVPFQREERSTSTGFCKDPTLGSYLGCLQLFHSPQGWQDPGQRGCLESLAATSDNIVRCRAG